MWIGVQVFRRTGDIPQLQMTRHTRHTTTARLWQSTPPYLESSGSIMSDDNEVRSYTIKSQTIRSQLHLRLQE